MCNNADNYSSTYDELHSKLFAEQKEGIRLIWEYINMMYQDYEGNDFQKINASQLDNSRDCQNLQEIQYIAFGRRKSNHWSFQILFGI